MSSIKNSKNTAQIFRSTKNLKRQYCRLFDNAYEDYGGLVICNATQNLMCLVGRLAQNEPIWILMRDDCNAII